jgi:hypothetical protein
MMTATKTLPEQFALHLEINLQKDRALLIKLNLWGLVLLPVIGYFLVQIGVTLHPEFHTTLEVLTTQLSILVQILGLILGLTITTILHELVHGISFWIITHQLPRFGFRGAYAFAAAPGWYIPRNAYFIIGAAPLVILSILGIIFVPIIPSRLLYTWLFCLLVNASGAVGDVYVLGYIVRQPATAMVQDRGDIISVYTEAAS